MNNRKQWAVPLSAALVLLAVLATTDNSSKVTENPDISKVTFVVS